MTSIDHKSVNGRRKARPASRRLGFTLVEVMLAAVISVMVFSAMGIVLTRCFSLWKDAMAHWQLAQYGRVVRTRVLFGGFGPGTGLLSATNHTVAPFGNYTYVTYYPLGAGGLHQAYGRSDTATEDLRLARSSGSPALVLAQSVTQSGGFSPPVKVCDFQAVSLTNRLLRITYELRLSSMGKTFVQPQTIRASLVNE